MKLTRFVPVSSQQCCISSSVRDAWSRRSPICKSTSVRRVSILDRNIEHCERASLATRLPSDALNASAFSAAASNYITIIQDAVREVIYQQHSAGNPDRTNRTHRAQCCCSTEGEAKVCGTINDYRTQNTDMTYELI